MRRHTPLALALPLLLATAPAQAQVTPDECQARIQLVLEDLDAVTIGGNHPEQTYLSLQSKLQDAIIKLDEGKFADAYQKLIDFETAVTSLSPSPLGGALKPKLSAEDADLLLNGDGFVDGEPNLIDQGVSGAIDCVEELMLL